MTVPEHRVPEHRQEHQPSDDEGGEAGEEDGGGGGVLGGGHFRVELGVEAVDRIFERAVDQLEGEDEGGRQGDGGGPEQAGAEREDGQESGEGERGLGPEALLAAEDAAKAGERVAEPGGEAPVLQSVEVAAAVHRGLVAARCEFPSAQRVLKPWRKSAKGQPLVAGEKRLPL